MSSRSLANAMIQMLNAQLASEFSKRARAKAEKVYDMNKVFQRVEALIARV